MQYTLMHKNIAVADMELDEATSSIQRIDAVYRPEHLPVATASKRDGTVDIKEIVAYFEYVFDIDLGDFYHTYMELKAKTKDRTGFLSTLKDRLLMRMREQD